MEAAGVNLIASYDEMSVMGFVEILTHLPRHFELLSDMRSRLSRGRVSLLVVVDYPGFNMKVARAAHESGVVMAPQNPCQPRSPAVQTTAASGKSTIRLR